MDLIKQCEAEVWSGWQKYQCSKNAKVERNGKHYCTIHDPERAKKKAKENEIKFEEERRDKEYTRKAKEYCEKKGMTLDQLNDALSEKDDGS